MTIRLLIVEENDQLRSQYTAAFEPPAYSCKSVSTTQQALHHLQTNHPDVMIVNTRLVNDDAEQILGFATTRYRTKPPKVILIARHTHADTMLISTYKPDFVLIPPVDTEELVMLVEGNGHVQH